MCDIYNVSVTSNFPLTKIFLDTSPSVKILLFLLFTFYDFIDVHFHIYFALCKRCFLLPKLTKRDMGWRGCDKKVTLLTQILSMLNSLVFQFFLLSYQNGL